jgi:hypothetical protein
MLHGIVLEPLASRLDRGEQVLGDVLGKAKSEENVRRLRYERDLSEPAHAVARHLGRSADRRKPLFIGWRPRFARRSTLGRFQHLPFHQAQIIAKALDAVGAGPLDPGHFGFFRNAFAIENTTNEPSRLEADLAFIVGCLHMRPLAQCPVEVGARLGRPARHAETLLGIVTGTREAQCLPVVSLAHAAQNAAGATFHLVFQSNATRQLIGELGFAALPGLGFESAD